MIEYLAKAQSHGSEIDADTQMEMIFEYLSKDFIYSFHWQKGQEEEKKDLKES